MIFLWIVVSIIMFSLIVLFHEYGHFKSARIFWVKVEEFWLGIPPQAKKLFTDKKGTVYTLNWLPLWGFVKLKGEQFHSFLLYSKEKKLLSNKEIIEKIKKKEDLYNKAGEKFSSQHIKEITKKIEENLDKDNLINKPYWQQSIIILGWVAMNFFLAFIIFSVLFMIGVKPIWINDKIETSLDVKLIPTYETALKDGLLIQKDWILLSPIEGSIAEKSWIQKQDILLEINWIIIQSKEQAIEIFTENKNIEMSLVVLRNNEKNTFNMTPSSEGKIGSYVSDNVEVNMDFEYKYWFIDAIILGAKETYSQSILTFSWLKILFSKVFFPETKKERTEAIESMAGPIGIVWIITNALAEWVVLIVIIGAIISINLWVFNLLPIPALDGGRFFFICMNAFFQKLTGKKWISPYLEWSIHVFFFIFLIALSIIIAYNDVSKLISK